MDVRTICTLNEFNTESNLPIDPISYEDILPQNVIDVVGRCYDNDTVKNIIERANKDKKEALDPFSRLPFPDSIMSFFKDKIVNYSNYYLYSVPKLNINLVSLNLSKNSISDISPLISIQMVETLDLSGNKIKNIEVISTFKKLKELNLNNNLVEKVPELSKTLEILYLSFNKVNDISNLSRNNKLLRLKLNSNNIEDISSLENLKELNYLILSRNNIKNLESLKNLKELKHLFLNNNYISDAKPLRNLKKLSQLNLESNSFKKESDVDFLRTELKNVRIKNIISPGVTLKNTFVFVCYLIALIVTIVLIEYASKLKNKVLYSLSIVVLFFVLLQVTDYFVELGIFCYKKYDEYRNGHNLDPTLGY